VKTRTSILALPSLLLIAACGASAPAAKQAQTSADARQVLLASVQKSTGTSFLADMTINVSLTATGPAATSLSALAGKAIAVTMHMSAESQQRIRLTVDEAVAGAPVSVVAVRYDGTTYVSSDGGTTFKVAPSTGALPDQYASDNALSYLQSVAAVTDEGANTADGVAVERYSAQLDGTKVLALIRAGMSSSQTPAMQQLFSSMTFKGGALQVTIDQQGRVVTESGPIDASVDLGSFGASLAGTRMNIHEVVDGHFHDYGSAVTVTRPAAAAVTAS
jgi:hypothetical protein